MIVSASLVEESSTVALACGRRETSLDLGRAGGKRCEALAGSGWLGPGASLLDPKVQGCVARDALRVSGTCRALRCAPVLDSPPALRGRERRLRRETRRVAGGTAPRPLSQGCEGRRRRDVGGEARGSVLARAGVEGGPRPRGWVLYYIILYYIIVYFSIL